MDIEEIKTLTDLMVENDLAEIMIRDGDKRIVLRRSNVSAAPVITTASMPAAPAAVPAPGPPAAAQTTPAPAASAQLSITSPMVGTFYAASDPESPPFIKIGDRVSPDSVVCIIEAMKVFNEIKAEKAGIIETIEVNNGAPVEFGQALFRLRPA